MSFLKSFLKCFFFFFFFYFGGDDNDKKKKRHLKDIIIIVYSYFHAYSIEFSRNCRKSVKCHNLTEFVA